MELRLLTTVKHGGGIMLRNWCMAQSGLNNETLKISGMFFQQYNDPKHTSKLVSELIKIRLNFW